MATYDWTCHDCRLIWEREYPLAKNPSRTRCPECRKLCERNWSQSPAVHFKGGGWMTKGGGELQGSADEMNKAMQEGVKKRIEKGFESYKVYSPSQGYIDSIGAPRLSDEQVKKKLNASKKASAEVYDKVGIDPSKRYKPQ